MHYQPSDAAKKGEKGHRGESADEHSTQINTSLCRGTTASSSEAKYENCLPK